MRLTIFIILTYCQILTGQQVANLTNLTVLGYADQGCRSGKVIYICKTLYSNANSAIKELSKIELDSINLILSKAKSCNISLFHDKIGSDFLFLKGSTNNDGLLYMTIDVGIISDYSNHKNYWIKDEKDRTYLKYLINQYKADAPAASTIIEKHK